MVHPGRFLAAGSTGEKADGSIEAKPRSRAYLIGLGVATIVAIGLLLTGLSVFNQNASTLSFSTTTSTSFNIGALPVVAAVTNSPPSGYQAGTSKQLTPNETGILTAAYGTYFTQTGAIANMTILVFDGPFHAQAYGDSVINNEKGLTGYANLNGSLASYTGYGTCYGFGEADPEGNGAVATGQCIKGNVYIQVMVVSTSSLSSAEGDMSAFVGDAYHYAVGLTA